MVGSLFFLMFCIGGFLTNFASVAGAQTLTTLVKDADPISGVGSITSIDNVAVNDSGAWLVEADTDNPDTVIDSVIPLERAVDGHARMESSEHIGKILLEVAH